MRNIKIYRKALTVFDTPIIYLTNQVYKTCIIIDIAEKLSYKLRCKKAGIPVTGYPSTSGGISYSVNLPSKDIIPQDFTNPGTIVGAPLGTVYQIQDILHPVFAETGSDTETSNRPSLSSASKLPLCMERMRRHVSRPMLVLCRLLTCFEIAFET